MLSLIAKASGIWIFIGFALYQIPNPHNDMTLIHVYWYATISIVIIAVTIAILFMLAALIGALVRMFRLTANL